MSLCTSMGDEAVVRNVIELFRLEILSALETIHAPLHEPTHEGADRGGIDLEARAAAAHQLKGSAGFMGALELGQLCHRYHTALRESRLEDAARLQPDIDAACTAVLEWLDGRGWLASSD